MQEFRTLSSLNKKVIYSKKMCPTYQDQIRITRDENENEFMKSSLAAEIDGDEEATETEQAEDREKGFFLLNCIQHFGIRAKTPEEWRQEIALLHKLETKKKEAEAFNDDLILMSQLATRSSFRAILSDVKKKKFQGNSQFCHEEERDQEKSSDDREEERDQEKSSDDRDHVQELGNVIFCAATLALVKTLKFWKFQIFWYYMLRVPYYTGRTGLGFSIMAFRR